MAQEQPDASDGTAADCERMPYQQSTDPAFGQRAAHTFVASRTADDDISLVGSCPRCHAGMEVVVPGEIFLANRTGLLRRMFERTDWPESPAESNEQVVPMICLCPAPHPGRPRDGMGCGAFWNLTVEGQR